MKMLDKFGFPDRLLDKTISSKAIMLLTTAHPFTEGG